MSIIYDKLWVAVVVVLILARMQPMVTEQGPP